MLVSLLETMPISESPETTQSSVSPTAESLSIPQKEGKQSSGNPILRAIGNIFTLIFRLGLLTGGAGIAMVVGVAIATIRPAEVSEPPLFENIVQQVERFRP